MPELDRIDFGIIAALQKNARLSNKELAARVGLAPSSCLTRVRRLRQAGVLGSAHWRVDPHALGIGLQAMLAVRLRRHGRADFDAFHQHALALPETVALYHITGDDDFLIHVAVRDADHLRDLALDAFTTRPEVDRLRTSLVYDHQAQPGLPCYACDDAP
ncbi:MAG: Lrp/AsnC family transcriptional regulator [Myxococcales bacterium]|nr:Lrp/AsnC family transcriptional regulator [Myxococcales bacterium]MCB9523681.1 Lrp/AsnC family transcriptional regulator [Myxococcales bacterium]